MVAEIRRRVRESAESAEVAASDQVSTAPSKAYTMDDQVSTAPSKAYTMDTERILQFGIMVEDASRMISQAQKDTLKDIADHLTSSSKCVVGKDQLIVTSRTVDKDHPFTFASVHRDLPLPDVVERVPMVVQVVFKEGIADKLFVRIKNDLNCYDGVTAMHTSFQVLEFMEHGTIEKVSPFRYKDINGSQESHQGFSRVMRFFAQLFRILFAILLTFLSPAYWRGSWMPGPLQCSMEESSKGIRVCRRYNKIPESLSFKEITTIMDTIRTTLKLPYYAVTVNFSPTVALALVPTLEDLKNREARLRGITLPPAGIAPPPAMNASHATGIFNCLFYNNYGRHNPNISGKVTDFLWDWMGLLDTFLPFTHCIEIQGKRFVRWCAHPEEWKKIESTGLLSKLGDGEVFHPVPFYSKGA